MVLLGYYLTAILYKLLLIASLTNIGVFYFGIIRRRVYNNTISGLLNSRAYRRVSALRRAAVKAA